MKRPPTFTTEVTVDYVEVTIEPDELEDAGWVYVGENEVPSFDHVVDVVRDFHDDEHPGPWRFCENPPCARVRPREVP